MELTQKDKELAHRYIVIRSAIKALTQDRDKTKEAGLELEKVYLHMIESALVKANNELRELNKWPINVKKTSQPTVYDIGIGNRLGYIEINIVEITEEIEKFF